MPAVTQSTGAYPYFNVAGSLRQQTYQVSGSSADFLDVGLISVLQVIFDPGTITAYTVSSLGNGQSRITFTAGGVFTNVNVTVIGN